MKKYLVVLDCGGREGIDNIVIIHANSKEDVPKEFFKIRGYELDEICSVVVDIDSVNNGWHYF